MFVYVAYQNAATLHFFADDFQWLADTFSFRFQRLWSVEHRSHFYRPVIELYFYITSGIIGFSPQAYHQINIILHLINICLVYALAITWKKDPFFALVSALFFGIHPGYVEAVTWVSAVGELFSASFFCLTLIFHYMYLERRSLLLYCTSILFFTLCLLTHEVSVTLLPMMVIADYVLLKRSLRSISLKAYIPFLLPLPAYLITEYNINSRSYLIREHHYALGFHYWGNLLEYLTKLSMLPWGTGFFIALVILIITIAIIRSPLLILSAAWILVTLTPVLFFTWDSTSRYLYLPTIGFSMLLVEVLSSMIVRSAQHRFSAVFAPAVCIVAIVLIFEMTVLVHSNLAAYKQKYLPYESFFKSLPTQAEFAQNEGVVSITKLPDFPPRYIEPLAKVFYRTPRIFLVCEDQECHLTEG